MKPFVIDVFSVDGHGDVRKKRLESDSFESAEKILDMNSALSNVNRVVISRRIGGGGVSKMRVWSRDMAA